MVELEAALVVATDTRLFETADKVTLGSGPAQARDSHNVDLPKQPVSDTEPLEAGRVVQDWLDRWLEHCAAGKQAVADRDNHWDNHWELPDNHWEPSCWLVDRPAVASRCFDKPIRVVDRKLHLDSVPIHYWHRAVVPAATVALE